MKTSTQDKDNLKFEEDRQKISSMLMEQMGVQQPQLDRQDIFEMVKERLNTQEEIAPTDIQL
jgi:hypothetical protein